MSGRGAAAAPCPVLVAYNIPFRDCAQYSAGGAVDTASYEAWIDGFAAGIGKRARRSSSSSPTAWASSRATATTGASRRSPSGRQHDPAPGADPATRYAQLNYAVDKLAATARRTRSSTSTARTAAGWASATPRTRLAHAGVARARGLLPERLELPAHAATSLSTAPGSRSAWRYRRLPRWQTRRLRGAARTSTGTAVRRLGIASNCESTALITRLERHVAAVPEHVGDHLRSREHGWIDRRPPHALRHRHQPQRPRAAQRRSVRAPRPTTSRRTCSARSPAATGATRPAPASASRPTANTGVALLDAYLWVKMPGESDGSCDIAGGARAWDYTAYNPWSVTRRRPEPLRSAVGHGRSGRRPLVPAAGAAARAERDAAAVLSRS